MYCAHNAHHFCPLEYLRFPGKNFENLFIFLAFDSFLNLSHNPEHTCAIFLSLYEGMLSTIKPHSNQKVS